MRWSSSCCRSSGDCSRHPHPAKVRDWKDLHSLRVSALNRAGCAGSSVVSRIEVYGMTASFESLLYFINNIH
jgi:hypothetical protein